MADNLVKRLRDSTEWYHYDAELKMKCAGRIEELEAKLAKLTKAADRLQDCYYDSGVFIAGMTDLIEELTGDKEQGQ